MCTTHFWVSWKLATESCPEIFGTFASTRQMSSPCQALTCKGLLDTRLTTEEEAHTYNEYVAAYCRLNVELTRWPKTFSDEANLYRTSVHTHERHQENVRQAEDSTARNERRIYVAKQKAQPFTRAPLEYVVSDGCSELVDSPTRCEAEIPYIQMANKRFAYSTGSYHHSRASASCIG